MKKNATKKNSKPNKKTAPVAEAPAPAKASKAPKGKPGRPLYVPKFPRKMEWTLKDFCVTNDVDPETGKGPRCSKLTLIKWLGRDKARKGRSIVKRLDHTAPPESEKGLGRKAFLFSLREKMTQNTPDTSAPKVDDSVPSGDVTVPVAEISPSTEAPAETPTPAVDVSPETTAYEAQKAALLS